MTPPVLLDLADARHRFNLDDTLVTPLDDNEDGARVLVHTGPTTVDHVPLDFFALDRWAGLPGDGDGEGDGDAVVVGVVVDGDLTVTGGVLNAEADFGPFLHVRGSLTAGDVFTAGGELVVTGGLTARRSLVGFYNHGSTRIDGPVIAEVVLVDEHQLRIGGPVTATLVVGGNFLQIGGLAQSRVGHWTGRVADLTGATVRDDDESALRLLDPALFDWTDWHDLDESDQATADDVEYAYLSCSELVLPAVRAGRSLLRGDRPWGTVTVH